MSFRSEKTFCYFGIPCVARKDTSRRSGAILLFLEFPEVILGKKRDLLDLPSEDFIYSSCSPNGQIAAA